MCLRFSIQRRILRKSIKTYPFFLFFFQKKFKANRAFPSCHLPLYQNESSCETICMGMCSLYGFYFMQIKLSFYERFCTKTCFKTDAPVDSEMTYYLEKMPCLPPFLCGVAVVSHTTIVIGSCRWCKLVTKIALHSEFTYPTNVPFGYLFFYFFCMVLIWNKDLSV